MTLIDRYKKWCKKQEEKDIKRVKENPRRYKIMMVVFPVFFCILWSSYLLIERPPIFDLLFIFAITATPLILIEYDIKKMLKNADEW